MRNVVITGASRGLGFAIAHKLAMTGYTIIAIARRETAELASLAREAERERRGAVHFRPFDLAEVDALADLVGQLRGDFGRIYGLVNNAALGTSGLLATMHNTQIERTVRLNTVSPIVLSKYVVRSMMTGTDGGRIINIASIVGFTGYSGAALYGATKAAMIGFTRSLAREIGPLGVTVNAVAPGFIDTEMTHGFAEGQRAQIARRSALRRMADSEDVANAVAFLLSDEAKNITGTVFTVDAGNTA
jgi:3-oxoacyl-[acyl-carrier protein] reductase